MAAKEKAIELLKSLGYKECNKDERIKDRFNKLCIVHALICVDEILKVFKSIENNTSVKTSVLYYDCNDESQYHFWKQVKEEINKL